ncbi:heterokaryon incompatibility protein-domain-containing protein [Scleroderma yunnanense]
MRLINVKAILDISEGGEVDDETQILVEQSGKIAYAILSHCWGRPQEEVHFKDMEDLARMDRALREKLQLRSGYQKILMSCEQARKDQLQWVWVDTCCINKESSAELTEAINSMFRWYENSHRCYAYLHDVSDTIFPTNRGEERAESRILSKWFTRGWTLQELIAPKDVQFFNKHWTVIGDKRSLALSLERITRVPARVLKNGLSSHPSPSVAQIMSWACDRETTREEDRAYSLLGLFGVYMPMLYGEGRNAFRRLQLEIIRMSNDHSIFAWDMAGGRIGQSGSVLADDPSFFRDCHDIVRTKPHENEILRRLERGEDEGGLSSAEPLNTFIVTNGGIQIRLSLRPYRGSPSVFRATLECNRRGSPIGIDLASYESTFYRYLGANGVVRPIPEFREIYLAYGEKVHQVTFKLDARTISYSGFDCCGIFPYDKASSQNSFTLSNAFDLVIIVYANDSVNFARFAVALGCCFGQDWVHIICDEPLDQGTWLSWEDFAKNVYEEAWTAGPDHARKIAETRSEWSLLIKHAHVPRSIWGVDVINYGRQMSDSDGCTVMVDVVQCTGCCKPPTGWQILHGSVKADPDLPGLMIHTTHSANMDHHDLLVDGIQVRFLAVWSSPGLEVTTVGGILIIETSNAKAISSKKSNRWLPGLP